MVPGWQAAQTTDCMQSSQPASHRSRQTDRQTGGRTSGSSQQEERKKSKEASWIWLANESSTVSMAHTQQLAQLFFCTYVRTYSVGRPYYVGGSLALLSFYTYMHSAGASRAGEGACSFPGLLEAASAAIVEFLEQLDRRSWMEFWAWPCCCCCCWTCRGDGEMDAHAEKHHRHVKCLTKGASKMDGHRLLQK